MATLLLIDDDPDLLRDRVSHVFPAPAHRVEIAQTAAEGLERVAAACPDVILLDLRLPDQSGLDILRQLRRLDARIPVVMVTVARSSDSAIEDPWSGEAAVLQRSRLRVGVVNPCDLPVERGP